MGTIGKICNFLQYLMKIIHEGLLAKPVRFRIFFFRFLLDRHFVAEKTSHPISQGHKLSLTTTFHRADDRDKVRMNSVVLQKSGSWLNVIPSRALCLHLKPREFRVSMLYRLGMKVFSSTGLCSACQSQSDAQGDQTMP